MGQMGKEFAETPFLVSAQGLLKGTLGVPGVMGGPNKEDLAVGLPWRSCG